MSYYYSWELDSIDRESIFDTPETEEDFYELKEDMPVNNVSGGNIAGLGVGPQGEPGIKKIGKWSF